MEPVGHRERTIHRIPPMPRGRVCSDKSVALYSVFCHFRTLSRADVGAVQIWSRPVQPWHYSRSGADLRRSRVRELLRLCARWSNRRRDRCTGMR